MDSFRSKYRLNWVNRGNGVDQNSWAIAVRDHASAIFHVPKNLKFHQKCGLVQQKFVENPVQSHNDWALADRFT